MIVVADDVVRDIPEEMVDAAATALGNMLRNRDSGIFDRWDVHGSPTQRNMARSVLSAALAGRQVVDLPDPDGTDDGGTWWNHDLGAVIADNLCTAETAQVMRRRVGALLAAAAHIERNLAAGSGSGED